MAWIPLADRLNTIPKIICGPILRRVERDNVSVFIATRVYNGTPWQLKIFSTDNPNSTSILSGTIDPVQIGENLWVGVITATGGVLTNDTLFYYDVSIGGTDNSLLVNGVVSFDPNLTKEFLCYGNKNLPSFMLPASDLLNLKVVHSSCRKAHGGGLQADKISTASPSAPIHSTDEWYDTEVFKKLNDYLSVNSLDVTKRPQLQFLTGDQIYADDVADIVLFIIKDIEKTLFGPNYIEDINITIPKPGGRGKNFIINHAFPTQEDGSSKSHLVQFSEFSLMYILMWSPTLWMGGFTVNQTSNSFTGSWLSVPEIQENMEQNIEIKGDNYYRVDEEGEYIYPPYYLREQYAIDKKGNSIGLSEDGNFITNIKHVRKVLANIPTYMVFDDHEITDDWNINLQWVLDSGTSDSYSNSTPKIGRKIIRNGLMAYELFQMWGNNPKHFASKTALPNEINSTSPNNTVYSSHYRILQRLKTLYTSQGWNSSSLYEIGILLVPKLNTGTGNRYLDSARTFLGEKLRTDFYYKLSFNYNSTPSQTQDQNKCYTFYALDTRTERYLPSTGNNRDSSGLIHLGAQLRQMLLKPNTNSINPLSYEKPFPETSFFISGAPFLGVGAIEDLQSIVVKNVGEINFTIKDKKYQPLNSYGKEALDQEAWSNNKAIYYSFVKNLSTYFDKIIILSGDVHYSSSVVGNFWVLQDGYQKGLSPAIYKGLSILQLTASSSKNSFGPGIKGKVLNYLKNLFNNWWNWSSKGFLYKEKEKEYLKITSNNIDPNTGNVLTTVSPKNTEAIYQSIEPDDNPDFNYILAPDFQYQISYLHDAYTDWKSNTKNMKGGLSAMDIPIAVLATTNLVMRSKLFKDIMEELNKRGYRTDYCSFMDNFGLISFKELIGSEPVVRHQIFQSKEDPSYSQSDPFVIHDHYHTFLTLSLLPSESVNDDFN